jgi:hypothetical protein
MGTSAQQLMRQLMQVGGLPPEDEVSPGKVVQNGTIMAQGALPQTAVASMATNVLGQAPPTTPSIAPEPTSNILKDFAQYADENPLNDNSAEMEDYVKKNRERADAMYSHMGFKRDAEGKLNFIPVEQQVQENLKTKYSTKGGTAKKFLLDFLGGMGAAVNPQAGANISPTLSEHKNVMKQRAEAKDLFGTVVKSDDDAMRMLQALKVQGMKAEQEREKNYLRATSLNDTAMNQGVKTRLYEMQVRADVAAKTSGMKYKDAQTEQLLKENANIALYGTKDLNDLAEQNASVYAKRTMYQNPAWRLAYQTNPDRPDLWAPPMREAWNQALADGYESVNAAKLKADVAKRAAGGGGKRSGSQWRWMNTPNAGMSSTWNPETRRVEVNKVGLFSKINENGEVQSTPVMQDGSGKRPSGRIIADWEIRAPRVDQYQTDEDLSKDAFYTAGVNMDDDKFYGIIGGNATLRSLAQSFPEIAGLSPSSPQYAARIKENLESASNWVKKLYQYSGKQINEKEMQAMLTFIPNSLMGKSVYATLSATTYYTSMINKARLAEAEGHPLAHLYNSNLAETIMIATMMSMESAQAGKPWLMSEQQFANLHARLQKNDTSLQGYVNRLHNRNPATGKKNDTGRQGGVLGLIEKFTGKD